MCTFSMTPGVHDDLPMNCLGPNEMVAFCWWDGKHIVTEIAWEFVASNRGTTTAPWGNFVPGESTCRYGDSGRMNGLCPSMGTPLSMPLPIGSFPAGATRNPPGIHDLFGGLTEDVLMPGWSPYNPSSRCGDGRSVALTDGVSNPPYTSGLVALRGVSWFMSALVQQQQTHAASRGFHSTPPSVSVGFRCQRWVPEPRGS
jgi:hypothetical protein